MSYIRLGVLATLTTLILTGIGGWVFDVWYSQILSTLSRASVVVTGSESAAVETMRTGVALALGSSALLAFAVRALISRISKQPIELSQWAMTVGWLLFGSQVGLGGSLFAAIQRDHVATLPPMVR